MRITDPNKNVWTLTYDNSGNLASVADPKSFTVLAARNTAGQIISLADPKGNKRSYQYNADGLLTGFTDALGNQWTYDYDGAARPSSKADPTGVTLKETYTAGNRIASLAAGDTQTTFDYSGIQRDGLNRLARYSDSNGNQVIYAYDAAGQLTGITLPAARTSHTSTTTCIVSPKCPTGRAISRFTATMLPDGRSASASRAGR